MLFPFICGRILVGEFETFLTECYARKNKTKGENMKKATRTNDTVKRLVRGGLIAALYVAMTYLSFVFGLSSGVIQFRLAEALCILVIFMPEAVAGLTVGCLVANLLTTAPIWDVLFGAIATLIGAVLGYLLRKTKHIWLVTLPTVLSNSIIVPFILLYVYEAEGSYPFFFITVMIGEVVCAGVLGTLLGYALKKTSLFIDESP